MQVGSYEQCRGSDLYTVASVGLRQVVCIQSRQWCIRLVGKCSCQLLEESVLGCTSVQVCGVWSLAVLIND